MQKQLVLSGYFNFLKEIKQRIRTAQYEALRTVNKELISLYWDIGKTIVKQQQKEGWGKSIVECLALDLQKEFPGMQGFSVQNLWYMRQFYLEYHRKTNLQPLVGDISWTKNVLIHHIENQSYEKTLTNQTNFQKTLPDKIKNQAKLAVKDEYTFDFLELGEEHSEAEFERALLAKVNKFLIEMGGTLTFVGNQFRIEIDGDESFIDLLLYHRRLRCLVAVELKISKFLPEHVGKMQFYLSALDSLVKEKDENPSIGIILCKEKKRTIVEYALRESNKPIAVANYRITSALPKNLQNELPAPEQIRKLLDDDDEE